MDPESGPDPRPTDGPRDRLSRAWARARADWARTLVGFAAAVWVLSLVRHLLREADPVVGVDPALYQHVGWYTTQGASPYVHAFDVKPPLVYESTTLLAYLSGGNPYVLHGLSVLATGLAFVAIVVLVGKLAHRITGSSVAALAAGGFLLAFAPFHLFAVDGFRPKYFALAAGLGCLWTSFEDRPLAAGMLGAASAGLWHLGVVFPGLALVEAARRRSSRDVGSILLGGVLTAILILTPMVAWGAFEAMVTETLLAPTMTGEGGDLLFRGAKAILHLAWTLPLALLGAWGLARTLQRRAKPRAWLGLGLAFVVVQLVFLDYDGQPDLFLGFLFAAIGFGVFLAGLSGSHRRAAGGLLGATLVVSVVANGGLGIVFAPAWESGTQMREDPALVHRGLQQAKTWVRGGAQADGGNGTQSGGAPVYPEVDSPYGPERMGEIYWEQIRPESCHYRLGDVELWWLELTNRSVVAETCGDWPDGAWGLSW